MDFYKEIEHLLSIQSDSFKIAKLIKSEIKTYLNSLDTIFEQRQGKDFLVKHTKQIDRFLNLIYKTILRQFFGNYVPMHNSLPLTLVAMGSYGREELCVYSDIDLMFVYKDYKGYNIEPIIEAILYLAWDSGFHIGHRVHKIDDLFNASKEDDTIKTAMLESRFLCGSKYLWMETQNELNRIRKDSVKEFINNKINSYLQRKSKFPLSMQPNIKECAGGLRDANTLFWIAKVIYNVNKLQELTPNIISESDFKELRSAIEFLYRLRPALHLEAKKKQDALLLEYIPQVAKRLKIANKRNYNAQVALASQTLKSLWTIKTITQILITRIVAPIFYKSDNLSLLRSSALGNGFYLYNDTLYVSFRKKPLDLLTLLRIFSTFEDRKMQFDIRVINLIRLSKIPTINSTKIYQTFAKFFHLTYLNQYLYAFYKAGILHHIVKPFKHTINLPQFDGYHKFPVDIHSLKALKHLENIEDPHVKEIYDSLQKNEKYLLRFVVFFHDIGKGKGGDHSEIGAKIFKTYAKKLNLSNEMTILGDRLIRHHILMSNVANRKDIYSEKVIFSFLAAIKTPQCLKLLYVLTYCDVSAVGENTYSGFNSRLVKELYHISLNSFGKDKLLDEASRRRRREKAVANNASFKALSPKEQKKIMNIHSNLFFLKFSSQKIIDISKSAFKTEQVYFEIATKGALTLTIIRNENINIAYILDKLAYLDVQEMEIFDLFDRLKYFKIYFKQTIHEEDKPYVQELINSSLKMENVKPIHQPQIDEKDIVLDCKHSDSYALINLNTKDQQGLLAFMMYIFDTFNLKISSAKIQTIKNRTRNLFLIEKQENLCNNREKLIKSLCTMKEKG